MATSYYAKNPLQMGNQLRHQSLTLPFKIGSNATPASVSISMDDPSILFLKTQGVDQITPALSSGETAPTYIAPNDGTGVFNVLVRISEVLVRVDSALLISRTTGEVVALSLPSAPSNGITAGTGVTSGQDIALNCSSAGNFATTNYDGCIVINYVVQE